MRRTTRNPLFSQRSARRPPPHFAGRKAELTLLHQGLDDLLRTKDPAGGIDLITGVPGVGKTQLARKFADEAAERHKGVVACQVGTGVLESPVDVLTGMARRLGMVDAARKVADVDSRRTGGGFGIARAFSKSHTREHVRHTPSFEIMLLRSNDIGMWKRCPAMVLVIDELQTVTPDGMKSLRVLHEGNHGCPVYLLGVGLQHTPFVLANPGGADAISRPNEPIRLGCLSESEAVEAVGEGLAKQGHDVPAESVEVLASHTDGFPQHIHSYLAGATTAIAEHGHLEAGAALDLALAEGDTHRDAYYDLTADKMAPNRSVIHPVVHLMRRRQETAVTQKEAMLAVSESGEDGDAIVQMAIEHGVLELDKDMVSFGIPSFHAHMQRSLDRALARNRGNNGS